MTILVLEEKCALCGRDKWYHILPAKLRREKDPKDDGHPFQPREMLDGRQMRLPFNVTVKPQQSSARLATSAGRSVESAEQRSGGGVENRSNVPRGIAVGKEASRLARGKNERTA